MREWLGRGVGVALPGVLFLAMWEGTTVGNPRLLFLFASPSLVWSAAMVEFGANGIWKDVFVTFSEAALGLFFGTVIGTLAGLLLWGNGKLDFVTRPYILFFASIPIFAVAPMTIIWFGVGLLSKAIMAGFAVFFISLAQAYEGAHRTAERHLGFASSVGASKMQVMRKIIVPGAIDWVIAGYKMNVGSALTGAFIGEFVSSEAGLGHFVLKSSALYDVPRVLLGVSLLSLVGIGMTGLAWLINLKRRPV